MKTSQAMLLDKYLPKYDFTEDHNVTIKAPPDIVYCAMHEVTLAEVNPGVRLLMWVRTLPENLVGRKDIPWNVRAPVLPQMCNGFFTFLAEQSLGEVVFGLIVPGDVGRVWKKSSDLDIHPATTAEFMAVNDPAYLKVVCSFQMTDANEPGCVTLRAEWRVGALSPHTRKRFIPYWTIIGPFSHFIQKSWVNAIKRRAERTVADSIRQRKGAAHAAR